MKRFDQYTDAEHDRAMARITADLGRMPSTPKAQPQPTGGICACLIVLLFILGLAVLLLAGCGTVQGIGQDLQQASEITREYMAQPSHR